MELVRKRGGVPPHQNIGRWSPTGEDPPSKPRRGRSVPGKRGSYSTPDIIISYSILYDLCEHFLSSVTIILDYPLSYGCQLSFEFTGFSSRRSRDRLPTYYSVNLEEDSIVTIRHMQFRREENCLDAYLGTTRAEMLIMQES